MGGSSPITPVNVRMRMNKIYFSSLYYAFPTELRVKVYLMELEKDSVIVLQKDVASLMI